VASGARSAGKPYALDGHRSMSKPAARSTPSDSNSRRFYHGTRADLKPGDLVQPGYSSNYTERRSPWVYFSETLDAATWGAELAKGEGSGRIYVVEPTGSLMDDPNLTDKKYPGNPTKSYRSREPLRVVGECLDWQGHSPEVIQAMKDRIAGLEPIDDRAGHPDASTAAWPTMAGAARRSGAGRYDRDRRPRRRRARLRRMARPRQRDRRRCERRRRPAGAFATDGSSSAHRR
jgi:hypothetical protein